MKELTIEQKAKRYDEAIRESSKIINFCTGGANIPECVSVKATIKHIFPELTESGDEKIRKAIIEFFELQDDNTTYSLIPKKDILAWLEKQGRQKTVDEIAKEVCKNRASATTFLKSAGIMNEKGELAEQYRQDEQKSYASKTMNEKGDFDNGFTRMMEKEQTPAWSEKDKEMSRFIGNAITTDDSSVYLKSKGIEVIDAHVWLDELKDRVQPKQEWTEEDESWFKEIELMCLNFSNDADYREKFSTWLKFLKGRVQPQPKQEWSEEDEKIWEEISDMLWEGYTQSCSNFTWDDIRDWVNHKIKSLRSQNTWKPSDEQIKAVRLARAFVTDNFDDNPTLSEILIELEKQLKKLREK